MIALVDRVDEWLWELREELRVRWIMADAQVRQGMVLAAASFLVALIEVWKFQRTRGS